MDNQYRKYLSANVDNELFTKVKIALAARNESMKDAIVGALKEYLELDSSYQVSHRSEALHSETKQNRKEV